MASAAAPPEKHGAHEIGIIGSSRKSAVFFSPSAVADAMSFLLHPCSRILIWSLFGKIALGANVLVVGDSWASRSLDYLSDVCAETSVVNRGEDGSTAYHWGQGSKARDAFSSVHGSGYSHVWLSVGGNDFLGLGCSLGLPMLSSVIGSALQKVKAAAPSGITILMTGYSTPSGQLNHGSCTSFAALAILNEAVKAACQGEPACKFVDVTDACGGSSSSYSDVKYFTDAIHLNQQGYYRIFRLPGVQQVLGCGSQGAAATTTNTIMTTIGTTATTTARKTSNENQFVSAAHSKMAMLSALLLACGIM